MHHDQHHTSDPITAHQQDLTQVLQAQAYAYSEKGIPSLKQRLATLTTLSDLLSAHQWAIADAISKDFGHPSSVTIIVSGFFSSTCLLDPFWLTTMR